MSYLHLTTQAIPYSQHLVHSEVTTLKQGDSLMKLDLSRSININI